MFADPMSVDFASGEKSFVRIDSGRPGKGSWVYDDGTYQARLDVAQNSTSNRFRREIRLTRTKVAADPITAVNKEVSASVIVTVDEPRFGFADIDLGLSGLLGSLIDTLQDDSGLVVGKLLNGES